MKLVSFWGLLLAGLVACAGSAPAVDCVEDGLVIDVVDIEESDPGQADDGAIRDGGADHDDGMALDMVGDPGQGDTLSDVPDSSDDVLDVDAGADATDPMDSGIQATLIRCGSPRRMVA